MIRTVLGIDLASAKWSSVGSATIEFDDEADAFTSVVAGAIAWPALPLTPAALADAIDAFARRKGVCAVALDGPQGWRDPATPEGTRGVGRRCEYECRTQGKTGAYPRTFPGTQRAWIEFSVEVFANLLARPGVALADPTAAPRKPEPCKSRPRKSQQCPAQQCPDRQHQGAAQAHVLSEPALAGGRIRAARYRLAGPSGRGP